VDAPAKELARVPKRRKFVHGSNVPSKSVDVISMVDSSGKKRRESASVKEIVLVEAHDDETSKISS